MTRRSAGAEPPAKRVDAPADAWYVAAAADELRARPLGRTVLGEALVLWRDERGRARAALDRCPHRAYPLSAGRIRDGLLECAYHGWRFDGHGACRDIPAHDGPPDAPSRRAVTRPALESDGYAWVWCGTSAPDPAPPALPLDPPAPARLATWAIAVDLEASLPDALENILDVPHTAFVHGGLFRTRRRRAEVEVVVRQGPDRVEAEYLGEPRPSGLAGRILAPGGGTVRHVDRFVLPSLAQVEYRLGERWILVIDHFLTPMSASVTRVHYRARFALGPPGWVVRPVLALLGRTVLRQDARALARQSANRRRFPEATHASTSADALGPRLRRLLEGAGRGAPPTDDQGEVFRGKLLV